MPMKRSNTLMSRMTVRCGRGGGHRAWCSAGTLASVIVLADAADATSPSVEPRIDVLAVPATSSGSPQSIDLRLLSDSIYEVVVETELISAANDRTVSPAKVVGVGLVNPASSDAAAQVGLGEDLVVAGKGDRVVLPWPHELTLSPGHYAEQLWITLVVRDHVVELNTFRYFEVTEKGILPSDGGAYSKAALRLEPAADGTMAVKGSWALAPVDWAPLPLSAVSVTALRGDDKDPVVLPPGADIEAFFEGEAKK